MLVFPFSHLPLSLSISTARFPSHHHHQLKLLSRQSNPCRSSSIIPHPISLPLLSHPDRPQALARVLTPTLTPAQHLSLPSRHCRVYGISFDASPSSRRKYTRSIVLVQTPLRTRAGEGERRRTSEVENTPCQRLEDSIGAQFCSPPTIHPHSLLSALFPQFPSPPAPTSLYPVPENPRGTWRPSDRRNQHGSLTSPSCRRFSRPADRTD